MLIFKFGIICSNQFQCDKKLKKKNNKNQKKKFEKKFEIFQIVGGREGLRGGEGGWRIVIPMPEALNCVEGRRQKQSQQD
jgi:hypothetical protein